MADQETLVRELTDILRRASSVKVGFDTLLTELADAVGADAMLAPVKSFARAMEKVCADYQGDAGRLKDAVRGTLVVETAAEAQEVLAAVLARTGEANCVVKRNWLIEGATVPSPMYRDVLMYVTINTVAMIQAKDYGHRLYEGARSLVAGATLSGDNLDEEEFKALQRLVRRQIQIYTDAWKRSQ